MLSLFGLTALLHQHVVECYKLSCSHDHAVIILEYNEHLVSNH